ncbi:2-phospho-L-lactate transferase [Naumannella sp. ID2617S]|uniref:2-phospho-L-lactate transferase n=1 Tax=Enemella dayhoffiae TaxID=2016507 RepID=A0A255GZ11_9ACTN|nr:2-phospho-L-lactate transferase [Enemella dayhoffiae]NNG20238.1 2-phospho-L-lactate transferase [Naumannella sp. ID2617S]OYO20819.1 2-phospho-L-lactate transferase [Enemella dayhoffiae]
MTNPNRIVVLAGGVGGSRFVRGVRRACPEAQLDVVVNTADDITLHGLRVCPDLDTMMYALGGGIDDEKGWGRAAETWSIMDELKAYAVEPTWFALGDRDIATHLVRTQLIAAGATPTEITAALCHRWLDDERLRLLPMTDDRVETHVVVEDPQTASGRRAMHFQEFWVRHHAAPKVRQVLQVGIETATATAEVLTAIERADLVLVGPSNPVVSIGPVLATGGVRPALRATGAKVVGVSGILGGAPVLGMADKLLPAIGVAVDAGAVGLHYGARTSTAEGILDAWLVHETDTAAAERCTAAGLPTRAVPLLMTTPDHTAEFVRAGVALAAETA